VLDFYFFLSSVSIPKIFLSLSVSSLSSPDPLQSGHVLAPVMSVLCIHFLPRQVEQLTLTLFIAVVLTLYVCVGFLQAIL